MAGVSSTDAVSTRLVKHHAVQVTFREGLIAAIKKPEIAGFISAGITSVAYELRINFPVTTAAIGLAGAGVMFEFAVRKDCIRGYSWVRDYIMTAPSCLDDEPIAALSYSDISARPLSELDDDVSYEIAISKKPGFKEEIEYLGLDKSVELSHASIAVKVDDTYACYGRQSPYFRNENPGELGITHIENEARYKLLGDTRFHITDLKMTVSGADIKQAIADADKQVCEMQGCDMYSSNCYTAAVAVLLHLHKILDSKPEGISQADSDSIKSGIGVLCLDNWMVGVATNPVIADELRKLAEFEPRADHKQRPAP